MYRLFLFARRHGLMLAGLMLSLSGCDRSNPDNPGNNNGTALEIKGADLSYLPEVRQSGLTFFNRHNRAEDMLTTLKNAGMNTMRLRLWHAPAEPTSGLNSVKAMAAEARSLGLKVLLSVHYSDSWADPAKQTKPARWQGRSFDQLLDSVYAYTRLAVAEIKPDYIQLGNEINTGLLWPEGHISNMVQMKALLTRAAAAVRTENAQAKIVIHFAGLENAQQFFSNLHDIDYDLAALSYYPIWHGKSLTALEQTLIEVANLTGKQVFIAETSYPFTLQWNDMTNNVVGQASQLIPDFPATPQGQQAFLQRIKDMAVANTQCIGFCYWGAEWVSYKGENAINGSTWENQALWSFARQALPAVEVFR